MLFPSLLSTWNSKKPGDRIKDANAGLYMLNPNRIIELRVHNHGNDHSKFFYADDPDDPRDSPGYIECNTTVAAIEAYYNTATPTSKFVTLAMFPKMDRTKTAVNTAIEWEDIAYIWQKLSDVRYNICHCVYYQNDFKRMECRLNHSLLDILVMTLT